MSFLIFILLILLLMVGIPLLRGWLYMQSLRKKVTDIFGSDGPARKQQQQRQHRQYEEEEEYTETGERKIYTSGEGEYADFEEVRGATIEETVTANDSRTIIEEQITDAEYEEIRD